MDYDTDPKVFTFNVLAASSGSRSLTATATVTVSLTPVNEATPTFTTATVSIAEDLTLNSEVKKFEAVDSDAGPDGAITYAIKSGESSGVHVTLHTNYDSVGRIM